MNSRWKLGSRTYLPVLGISQEHRWVFRLADLTSIIVLHLLGVFLSLNAIIFGEGALVTGSAGVGEEVRTNGLDAALGSCGEAANCFEVLLYRPSLREDGERKVDVCVGSHVGG
jgi:hypothetical protein